MHLGFDAVVRDSEIIGIFDIENTSISKHTRQFLSAAEKNGRVKTISYDMPKSFIVTAEKDGQMIYITPISAATLRKRADFNINKEIN